ncbi:DNA repair protein RecO [Spiroplasma chinense]|uniref:DNA repair protein RecO n=1 Tax=Spiroplasma chinense TaxID=216932 RepID=A0A5B9Y514_9MOLU|nr:DNA repair protein RecO [Spiroplasma chinense]QEH62050.1 DNA repair protein RecO [Spiroplasma chinense]
MGITKIEGIVINGFDYEDYAKVIKVYSKQFGLLSFFAPGVNKESSKNRYSLQTFSLSEFEIFKARKEDKVSKLKTGYLKDDHFNISKRYSNYIYCTVIVNVTEQLTEYGIKNSKVYNALKVVLDNIANDSNVFVNYLMFLMFFIQNSQYKMRLNYCYRCRKNTNKMMRFEYREKALVCKKCLWPGEVIQPESFVDIFYNFDRHTFHYLVEKHYDSKDLVVLHNFLSDYLENELGVYISASKILRKSASMYLSDKNQEEYK